jgi:predicted NAD/FAD-binding protein
MKTYYKIVDEKENDLFFLFHGLHGSRKIEKGKWLTARKAEVNDGTKGTIYTSGFYMFSDEGEAYEFLNKLFTYVDVPTKEGKMRAIVPVHCKGIRKKTHSRGNVLLADEIKFL